MGKLILKWAIVLTIATGITVINGVHENEKAERRDNPPKYGRVTLPYDYRDKSLSDYGIKVPKGQTFWQKTEHQQKKDCMRFWKC